MFEIDKKEFGRFLSELRKEKGMTQKELAEKLFVSDKAVSKWETGGSIPDVTLLMPLSRLLDVTVPELLECRRYEAAEQLAPEKAAAMMNTVIQMTDEEREAAERVRKRSQAWFVAAAAVSLVATFGVSLFVKERWQMDAATQIMSLMLSLFGLIFGVYACFMAKEKLPSYFDENKISSYSDGFFRMNMPGVHFNNSNWPHILRVIRIWSIAMLLLGPVLWLATCYLEVTVEDWATVFGMSSALMAGIVCLGIFIPIYVVAKKYE